MSHLGPMMVIPVTIIRHHRAGGLEMKLLLEAFPHVGLRF